jgi:hypothetical protein
VIASMAWHDMDSMSGVERFSLPSSGQSDPLT